MVEMDNNYNYNYNYNYWRKKPKEQNFNGGSRSRSQNYNNRRSSFGNGYRQPSELSLDKKFCEIVGGLLWKNVLETQRYMYQDVKVMNWEDSAVLEAFWNAKNRFRAEMLGQPCDLRLPDPDLFIDKVDWDSNVDPNLLVDLEDRDSDNPCETDQKYSGVVVGIPVVPEQYVLSSTGWGDVEEGNEHLNNPERHDDVNNAGKGCSNNVLGDVEGGDAQLNNPERYDSINNADKGCSNYGWEDNRKAEKGFSNFGWEDNYYHSGEKGVNNAEKCFSNNGWEDGFAYITHDMVNHNNNYRNGRSTWNGYKNNKRWDHGGYNKKSDHGNWNTSRYKISQSHHNGNRSFTEDFGSNKRGNVCSFESPLEKVEADHGNWNTSRYKISQSHHNGNRSFTEDFGSNIRGNFSSYERPLRKWRPVSRQW